jgi:colanic acid biosynthesis glycosyl transferase WcaI
MAAATEEGTAPSADQDRPVRIMFTGNLGYFQGLDVVIDAVRGLASDQLELVFVGDGAAKGALMDRAGDLVDRRIRFIPHQPVDALPELLATADLGLVSLAPNIIRVAYPSKTMTYLELGCPLLAVVETDTELARLIRNHDIGFVTPPGDVTSLQDAFAQVISRRDELAAMRPRARDVARQAFDPTRLLDQWSALYGELVAARRAA